MQKMDLFSQSIKKYEALTQNFTVNQYEAMLPQVDAAERSAFIRVAMTSSLAWELWIKDPATWGDPHIGTVFDSGTWDNLPRERKAQLAFSGQERFRYYYRSGAQVYPFLGVQEKFLAELNLQVGEIVRVGNEDYQFFTSDGKSATIPGVPASVGIFETVPQVPGSQGWAEKSGEQSWRWRTGEEFQALVDFETKYHRGCLLLDPKLAELFQDDPKFGPQLACPGRGKVEVVKVDRRLMSVFGDITEFSKKRLRVPSVWISASVSTGQGFPRLNANSGSGTKAALWLVKTTCNRDGGKVSGRIIRPKGEPTGGAKVLFDRWNTTSGFGRQSAYVLVWIPQGGTVPLDNDKSLTFDGVEVKEEYLNAPPKRYRATIAGKFTRTDLFGKVFHTVTIRWKATDTFHPEIAGECEFRFSAQPTEEVIWRELSQKDGFDPEVFSRHSVDLMVQHTEWNDQVLYRVEHGMLGYNRKPV